MTFCAVSRRNFRIRITSDTQFDQTDVESSNGQTLCSYISCKGEENCVSVFKMNTKKNKSKNRPKPPKSPQNVPDTIKVDTLSNVEVNLNIENVEKCENANKEEVKTPELAIKIEQIPKVEEHLGIDAPKKPKRIKAKKKQEASVEPTESDSKLNVSIATDVQKDENVGKATDETIVPIARKKKNKSKKNAEQRKVDNESQIDGIPQVSEIENKTKEEQIITPKTEEQIAQKEAGEAETLKIPEAIQKDSTIPKKKKKKKHRNDSDKSDVIDPCTLAFQKLLEPPDVVSEKIQNEDLPVDSTTRAEDSVTPIPETPTCSKENEKDVTPKSKKKNKKGKKPQLETETNACKENKPENEELNITTEENMELETTNIEQISKPKPKIIKPVQKKQKTKSESQELSTSMPAENITEKKIDENIGDILDKSEKSIKSEVEEKQKVENVLTAESPTFMEINSKSNLSEIKNETLSVTSGKIDNSGDISNPEEFSSLETDSKNEQQNIVSEKDKDVTETGKESDELGFLEVKTGKNKKKRSQKVESVPEIVKSIGASVSQITEKVEPMKSKNKKYDSKQGELKKDESEKSESKNDQPEIEIKQDKNSKESLSDTQQVDFDVSSVKSEDCEALSIVTPDLIQYPRSTSQQHLDDNNNTLIKEITTPDEIKLGIPIYTATPIVQGSGESPDSPLDVPIPIKATKVETNPSTSNNEKNDIKSRIFEVNKDMEVLRRSIERSLVELTGADKCDCEVDKEFEELFQEQTKEAESAEPEEKLERFQKPENIATQSDDKVKEEKKENIDIIKPKDENISVIDKDKHIKPEKIDLTTQPICVDDNSQNPEEKTDVENPVPTCPARNKGKSKSKKKGKKEPVSSSVSCSTTQQSDTTKESSKPSQSNKEKSEQKQQSSNEKGKQKSTAPNDDNEADSKQLKLDLSYEPIENFEDALTSSADDVNKTFEIIANEATESLRQNNPQINIIIAPTEDTEEGKKDKKQKENPASQPKNLLGNPTIPASSNKNDFKKEKNKPPSTIQAKVKIKDSVEIEKSMNKVSKESQTTKKLIKETNGIDTFSYLSDTNEDFVYKYSFRKVFLQSSCHFCKRELTQRFPCKFCSLVFYCSQKHLDEDWAKHQFLCFAVSTIAHLKGI